MEEAREQLAIRHLLQEVTLTGFRLHPLMREFFALKLDESDKVDGLRMIYIQTLVEVEKDLRVWVALDQIVYSAKVIPHLKALMQTHDQHLTDDVLLSLLRSVGRFYCKQALYESAELWFNEGIIVVRERAGNRHILNAGVFECLGNLHVSQSNLIKAEQFYEKALQILVQQTGNEHPNCAMGFYNLATLCLYQVSLSKFFKAMSLYGQALRISQKTLGWKHPDTRLIICTLFLVSFLAIMLGSTLILSTLVFLKTRNLVYLLRIIGYMLLLWCFLKLITSTRIIKFLNRKLAIYKIKSQYNRSKGG